MAFVPTLPLQPLRPTGTESVRQLKQPLRVKCPQRQNAKRRSVITTRMVANAEQESKARAFSSKGMSVDEFFERSIGEWRSQRSSHNLAWTQFEAVTSEINIEWKDVTDEEIVELCKQNKVKAEETEFSIGMRWEGESDWDDDEVMEGSAAMSVIKDGAGHGRLLRSVGYAETIPAVGKWEMTEDGVFVLKTFYDAAAAEERIWFATPDLRMRVSQIRTSSGNGVVTASFSTEIRKLSR